MTKKKVVFIGSFMSKSDSGHVGGQMFACNGLVNSALKEDIDWVTIDTTASTNKSRSFMSRLLGAAKRYRKFKKILRENKIDTVLAFCSRGNSFLEKGYMLKVAKKKGIKTILAPRSGLLLDDISKSSSFESKVQSIFNVCDYIVCQGTFWKKYFDTKFLNTESKTVVIHNWIDIQPLPRLNNQTDQTLVLFLGWIDKNKGIFDILQVAKRLESYNIKWILGGNGVDYESAKKAIVDDNLTEKVFLPGWILGEEKKGLLSQADIFILPSYREGLPNAMLESMGLGIPTIVSNVGAVSDIVEDRENGILIEPGNVSQIYDAVLDLHQDVAFRDYIGANARLTVKNKNSIQLGIEKFKKILV